MWTLRHVIIFLGFLVGCREKSDSEPQGISLKTHHFPLNCWSDLNCKVFFFSILLLTYFSLQSFSLLKIWHRKESQYVTQRLHPKAHKLLHGNQITLFSSMVSWVNFLDPLFQRKANTFIVINWDFHQHNIWLWVVTLNSKDTSKDF